MSSEHAPACITPPEAIHALVLGDLDPSEQRSLQSHLTLCPHCRALHRRALRLNQVLDDLPRLDCPPHLRAAIRSIPHSTPLTFTTPVPRRSQRTRLLGAIVGLAAAAGLALVLLNRNLVTTPLTPTQLPPKVVSSAELKEAERQVTVALRLLRLVGRESAARATDKLLARAIVPPARRLGLVLQGARPSPGPPSTPPARGEPDSRL